MNCFDELSLVLAIDRMESSEKKVFQVLFHLHRKKQGGEGFCVYTPVHMAREGHYS